MDAPCSTTAAATSSFIDWATAATPQHKQKVSLPDPFDARGSPFRSGDDGSGLATTATTLGNNQPSTNLPNQDVTTVLFTSGSSGPPKAVAVGVDAFVEDISGNISDAYAATSGVTISYIPLSHSSDRYKVWQHIVFGGRVAFVPFDAEQWDWREKDKESSPGKVQSKCCFQWSLPYYLRPCQCPRIYGVVFMACTAPNSISMTTIEPKH